MTNDNINNIISDAVQIAIHAKDQMTRLALEGLVNRLQALCDKGLNVTPKAVVDAVIVNPTVDREVAPRPPDEAREHFGKYLSVPALDMQFHRYTSANTTILVATWRDDVNSHVYVLRVERDGDSPNCGWCASATNDGHIVFQLRTKNRSNCEHFALSAMKRYLKRGHCRTYRTIAKAKEGK